MKDWVRDMEQMHDKFGVTDWSTLKEFEGDYDMLHELLKFRINVMVREEFEETVEALNGRNAEEVVDGLIDLCVFAIGTLDIFGVDSHKAWSAIRDANMAKEPGVKASRPNPWGLPDMIKPEGWVGPDHSDNHGIMQEVFDNASEDLDPTEEFILHNGGDK